MGKNNKNKIPGPSKRATLIFSEMQIAKRKSIEQLKKDWEIIINKASADGKLDNETIEVLKIYLGRTKKDPVLEVSDRINSRLDKLENKIEDNKSKIILTLCSNGDLYREPKSKHCYNMDPKSLRIKILKTLIKADEYIPGPTIKEMFGKSYETISSAIREINEISQKKLSLPKGKNNNLIISRDKGGYRINQNYPIQFL